MKKANSYSSQSISSPVRVLAGVVLVVVCLTFGVITLRNLKYILPINVETAAVVSTENVPAKIVEHNGRRYMIVELGDFGKEPEPVVEPEKPVEPETPKNEILEQPQVEAAPEMSQNNGGHEHDAGTDEGALGTYGDSYGGQ